MLSTEQKKQTWKQYEQEELNGRWVAKQRAQAAAAI